MRRLLASLAITATFVTPVAAAALAVPSDLIGLLQETSKPMDMSMELHAHVGTFYISAWMKGEAQGKLNQLPLSLESLKTLKENARLTLDVSDGKGTLRVRVQLRVIDGKEYFFIEEVSGNYDHELATVAASLKSKKWMMLSFDEWKDLVFFNEDMDDVSDQALEGLREALDGALQITRTGNSYSLMLKPEVGAALMSEEEIDSLNLLIKVETDASQALKSIKFYAAGSGKGHDHQANIVMQGLLAVRTKPVIVQVPAGAIDIREYINQLRVPSNFSLPGSPSDGAPIFDESTDEREPDDCSPESKSYLANVRKGVCGDERVFNRKR